MIEKIAEFTTTNINHPLSYVSTNPFVIYRKVIDILNNIDYRFESTRLKSFKNWPHTWTKSVQFVAAGFYYTGESDTVKCFECDIEIHTWLLQHDPMLEHVRWSKTCRFVHNYRCGNVPIGAESDNILPFMSEEYDTCELCEANMMTSLQLEKNMLEDINAKKTEKINSNLNAIIPKYPEYASYDARLRTYEMSPKILSQTKEKFAAAGLFYAGNDDQTLCYHCGGELKFWKLEDDPWEHHAKWFNHCPYLHMVKGMDYINRVTKKIYSKPINVSIDADSDNISSFMSEEYDTYELYEANMMTSLQLEKNMLEDINAKKTEKISSNLNAIIPKYPEYASYDARLRTYEMSPKILSQTKEEFAAAGLFYAGNDDQTLCYHCGGELKFWKLEDDPWEHHAKWFNHCPYLHMVKGMDYINRVTKKIYSKPINVSIDTDSDNISSFMSEEYDTYELYEANMMTSLQLEKNMLEDINAKKTEKISSNLNAIIPKYPEYASYDARLRTYEMSPKILSQTKEEFAAAGLFYAGNDDQTLCYHCGGELKFWKLKDDPWEHHAKWFNHCPYLHMVKGMDYINRVTKKMYSKPDTKNIWEVSIEQDAKCPLNELFAHECFQDLTSVKSIYVTLPFSTYVIGTKLSEPDITEPSITQELEDIFKDHKSFQDLISFEDESTDDK